MPDPNTPVDQPRFLDPEAEPGDITLGGRYRLEARIGAGPTGVVYRALDVVTQERVAVKLLDANVTGQPDLSRNVQRGIQLAQSLRHPNIARLLDEGRLLDGQWYLVFELVRGHSLASALAQGPLAVSRALSIARQIARALQAAHSAGLVHGDLRPQHVMLSLEERAPLSSRTAALLKLDAQDELVKLLGLPPVHSAMAPTARRRSHGHSTAEPEASPYSSPEQMLHLPVDARSDLYSAGAILYEMLAGHVPDVADVKDSGGQRRASLATLPAHVPPALVEVLSKLLADEAPKRFATAEQLLEALDQLDRNSNADGLQLPPSSRSGGVTRTAPPGIVRKPWLQRRRGPLGLQGRGIGLWIAGCALAAIGSAVVLGYRGTAAKPTYQATPGEHYHASASRGDEAALQQLLALPAADRTGTDWLALALGFEVRARPAEAVEALQKALETEPELATTPDVPALLWQIATPPPPPTPETASAAVRLTQQYLEDEAADLLLAMAAHEPATAEVRRRALEALQPMAEQASEAVQIAVETRTATSCQQLHQLAERIGEEGDARTAAALSALERVQSCPASGLCGACISQSPALIQAKSQAASRPAPDLAFR